METTARRLPVGEAAEARFAYNKRRLGARHLFLSRVLLFLAVVFWGWTFVATKVCLVYVSPLELMGLRLMIALPVLFVLCLIKGERLRPALGGWRLLLASVIIAAHLLIQITGLKYTSATNTGWIIAVSPLVIAVLAFAFLGERVRRRTVAGIVLATTGIVLLVSKGNLFEIGWLTSRGDWLVLLSAHTWALYTITLRDASRSRGPLAVTFVVLLPVTLAALAVMLLVSDWSRLVHLPTEAVVALLYLGVFGLALGLWFWQDGVTKIGAAEAGVFLYLEPVATTALAVPYLGESFGVSTALGGLMVLAGVWWAQTRRL